jgi:hypothetical protein
VKQGGVSSAILFAVYVDEFLALFRQAKLGCHINGIFYGALVLADNIFLLSGNHSGLQAMVDITSVLLQVRTPSLRLSELILKKIARRTTGAKDFYSL